MTSKHLRGTHIYQICVAHTYLASDLVKSRPLKSLSGPATRSRYTCTKMAASQASCKWQCIPKVEASKRAVFFRFSSLSSTYFKSAAQVPILKPLQFDPPAQLTASNRHPGRSYNGKQCLGNLSVLRLSRCITNQCLDIMGCFAYAFLMSDPPCPAAATAAAAPSPPLSC